MLRRWCMVLALVALTAGTALTATSASAAPSGGYFSPGGLAHLVSSSAAHTRGLSFEAESTNWSGYAGTTGRYTSVSASWVQPAGTCSSGDQYAAFWVGLDGYSSSTVEQTGSEVDCVGRTAEYYAWYEMYPGPSENYSNTVKAGDHFTAVTPNTPSVSSAPSTPVHLRGLTLPGFANAHAMATWAREIPRWSATWPTVLCANTPGSAFACSTVSGSSGQPGVSGA